MITTIIFDFDGVLHNTFPIAYSISRELYDISEEEYKTWFDGNIYNKPQITTEAIKKFYEMQKTRYIGLKMTPEIKKALIELKASYALLIISSNTEDAINRFLKENDAEFFNPVMGLETNRSKAEKFITVFKEHSKEECVFVTDTLGDIREANKVGIRTIAVDFGFHDREHLAQGKPFKIVSSFNELLDTIKKL